jgi:hypothetical protein
MWISEAKIKIEKKIVKTQQKVSKTFFHIIFFLKEPKGEKRLDSGQPLAIRKSLIG